MPAPPSHPNPAAARTRAVRLLGALIAVLLSSIAALSLVLLYQHRILSVPPSLLKDRLGAAIGLAPAIPVGKLPGPPREWAAPRFELNHSNSLPMSGQNDPNHERWRDIADNLYSPDFIARFSYAAVSAPAFGKTSPWVRVRINPSGPTLAGRLEARGLKPNFAYQLKLRGDPAHRAGFEAIGYVGRWRLPGTGTNYTDADYRRYPDWRRVESYILFDYFVTDSRGEAVRDFALDSSLHVLWKLSQSPLAAPSDLIPVVIDASDPLIYALPRPDASLEYLWAERESARYTAPDQVIRLPPGPYRAELVLTEESFHALGGAGGYWATVMTCPAVFTVTPTTNP